MTQKTTPSITVESDLKNLAPVRAFVRAVLNDLPSGSLTKERIDLVELAANELTTNIIRHGYEERPGQPIFIEAQCRANRMELRFHDHGKKWNPEKVPPPNFDGSQIGGFGLYIISQAVDEVSYCRSANGTNTTCLSIELSGGNHAV